MNRLDGLSRQLHLQKGMGVMFEWGKRLLASARKVLPLVWIDIKVNIYWLIEYSKVICKYYYKLPFMRADLVLILNYLFRNPYKISKRFLEKKGEANVYTYGETPLTTLETIVSECEIGSHDTVYELGCGRGRSCFWLSQVKGCRAVGIEFIPDFVMIADTIQRNQKIDRLEFRLQDMFQANIHDATVVYLYAVTLEDAEIVALAKKFEALPSGTAIITVSYSLEAYTEKRSFEVMKCFPAAFPWGTTDIYLQYRK